jgi:hypothetical protein
LPISDANNPKSTSESIRTDHCLGTSTSDPPETIEVRRVDPEVVLAGADRIQRDLWRNFLDCEGEKLYRSIDENKRSGAVFELMRVSFHRGIEYALDEIEARLQESNKETFDGMLGPR